MGEDDGLLAAVERIRSERLVAILRRVPDVDARVSALADAGFGVVEITLDDPMRPPRSSARARAATSRSSRARSGG